MADRHERVILEAITGAYQAKMAEAGAATMALEARVSGFHTNMRQADLSARGMISTLGGLASGSVGAAAGVAVAGAAVLKFAKDGLDSYVKLVSEVRNFQRVTGESAEASSIMIARAHALGISSEALDRSFFRLSQNVETNRQTLEAHGVEIATNDRGQIDLLKTLDSMREAYRRTGEGQQGNVIAQAAMSKGALQLLPLLAATHDRIVGIDEAARLHHELVTEKDISAVIDLKIATHDLSEAWAGMERELAQGVVPALTETFGWITKTIDAEEKGKRRVAGLHVGPIRVGEGLTTSPVTPFVRSADDLLHGRPVDAAKDLVRWHGKTADAAKDATRAEAEHEAEIEANTQAVQEYNKALDEMYGELFGVSSATDKFETDLTAAYTQLREARDAGDGFASSLATSSTTGLRNRAMLQGLEQDLAAAAKQYKELHPDATDAEIRKALSGQIGQLQVLLSYFSGDVTEAQNLRDVLNAIAGIDLSKPGKTYHSGWGFHVTNPFAGGATPAPPAPPVDTTSGSKAEAGAFLQSLWERRMEQVKNRFHEGRASLAEYERSLDEQMAHEAPWTDKWVQLQQEKADAVHYWTDATATYLQALASKQANLEDNMFEVGKIDNDAYVQILEKRLAALQMYSDEWVRVFKEIEQLQGDALDEQLKLIAAYDAGRQFQIGFDAAAQQRAMYSQLTPAGGVGGGTTTVIHSTSWSPSFTAVGRDAQQAMDLSSQKLRDFAVSR